MRTIMIMAAAGMLLGACSDDGDGGRDTTTGTTATDTANATDATVDPDTATPDSAEPDTFADIAPDQIDDTLADTTLVDVADTYVDTGPQIPEPNIEPDDSLCSPEGGARNIYDLQNPDCPDHFHPEPVGNPGVYVELTGVIVTGAFGDTWFVQDARSGPYSGITIYNHGLMSAEVEVGDVLDIKGNYSEFFENSQVYLEAATIVRSAAVPAPYVPAHPSHLATNGPLAEMFEGVLVKVEDVYTTHTRPDCPREYGEFEVTGGLRIDNMGFDSGTLPARWPARLGDHFASITGPLNFTFGNHKIEPRTLADVVVITAGSSTGISKCIASECQADASQPGTKAVVVNEIMADPFSQDTNQEWIELYNPGTSAVDVQGWQLRDCGDQKFTLTGPDLVIPAKGFLVVGMVANQNLNGGVPVDLAYGVQGFYLPNTVGSVLLYEGGQPGSALVDQTRYERFSPWDFQSGKSLERKSATHDGTASTSWQAAKSTFGTNGNYGTPGRKNAGQ